MKNIRSKQGLVLEIFLVIMAIAFLSVSYYFVADSGDAGRERRAIEQALPWIFQEGTEINWTRFERHRDSLYDYEKNCREISASWSLHIGLKSGMDFWDANMYDYRDLMRYAAATGSRAVMEAVPGSRYNKDADFRIFLHVGDNRKEDGPAAVFSVSAQRGLLNDW